MTLIEYRKTQNTRKQECSESTRFLRRYLPENVNKLRRITLNITRILSTMKKLVKVIVQQY